MKRGKMMRFTIIPRMIALLLLYICIRIEANVFNTNEAISFGGVYDKTLLTDSTKNNISGELENTSFHFLGKISKSNNSFFDIQHSESFLDKGASLSRHLKQMTNIELGVATLQDVFDTLPYVSIQKNIEADLLKMVQSLEDKFSLYKSLLDEMSSIVRESYDKFKEMKEKEFKLMNTTTDEVLNFGVHREPVDPIIHHDYYPCCVMADHYLAYNPHYGTKINDDLWCDSGLEHEKLVNIQDIFFTPTKLTEAFTSNYHMYPNLKWQFFMSASGGHTEFPAHRAGTSIGSECGQSSRHHHIYESTVRPNGRNIVLLFDLGQILRPRLLLTAKAIGHYVVDTLTEKDNIAMIGVGDNVVFPSPECTHQNLLPAVYSLRQSLRYFIDYMKVQEGPTNHTLALESALRVLRSWSHERVHESALIIYVTQGVLADLSEPERVMEMISKEIVNVRSNVVISAFGMGISHDQSSPERQFLETLSKQDFAKFGFPSFSVARRGQVIAVPATLRVAPLIWDFYEVQSANKIKGYHSIDNVTVSEVYWDSQGKGMVLTLSRSVYGPKGEIVGVVGIDLALAYLMEDVTYYRPGDRDYSFVIDAKGNALSHPGMGRPESWNFALLPTPITTLESSPTFVQLSSHVVLLPSGHKKTKGDSAIDSFDYAWKRSRSFHWIFIIAEPSLKRPLKTLSPKVSSLSSHALSHRLDLLSPQEAKVCRHFNQMATLDGASVFLSSDAYLSPNTYLSRNSRNLNADSNVMAFLTDQSKLIANPGLKEGVREAAASLFHISSHWQNLIKKSNLQKYIVRRYGATFNGVALIYPGTLLDPAFDPKAHKWFTEAVENPGKVIVSPPFLDPGGGGYIVTISHSVYQGKSTLPLSENERVEAVLAADFTLGYWLKLLVDIEPACANSIYFKDFVPNGNEKEVVGVRCLLMDSSGYLVSHSSFVDPAFLRRNKNSFPPHITHQEPVLSMSLLGMSMGDGATPEPILKKIWCADKWKGSTKRRYQFHLNQGRVFHSTTDANKSGLNERSCIQYKLTAVPSTDLILGFVNQTCSPATAFCPCSLVDRLCLNCQVMERAACECPCECPLPSQTCSALSNHSVSPGDPLEAAGKGEWHSPSVSCPRPVESPAPLQYGVGMLSQLDVCLPSHCETRTTIHSCLGVQGCVWCVFNSDAITPLRVPHCVESQNCYGGIKGGHSPYPPGGAPLPHSKSRGASLPVGPAAGGALAVFVVMGLAIYFYRAYVSSSTPRNYTPTTIHSSQNHRSYLYSSAFYPDKEVEVAEKEPMDDTIMSAAAAMSPYRMNPGYRRPCGPYGESSDPGYSTMTPHEESEHLFPSCSASTDERSFSTHRWSREGSEDFMYGGDPSQTRLSSPRKTGGPNTIVVPVTVHMVDTV